MKGIWLLVTLLELCVVCVCHADFTSERSDNWHQWRGPTADGVAADAARPPREWSESKNIKWKVAVPGKGHSSPIVWNDRIYLLTAIETDREVENVRASEDQQSREPGSRRGGQRGPGGGGGRGGRGFGGGGPPTKYFQFAVICIDRESGATVWQKVAIEKVPHEGLQQSNTHASGSPVTDGERLYANFGSHGTYCYDMDGNLLWSRDLGEMETRNGFGEGCSPAIHGDTLVVPWDHERQSFVFALDAKTGETKWQVERDELTTWATPLITDASGRTQVILNGSNRVVSYDLATGEVIWQCGGQVTNPIASPLRHDDLVYCMTGYRGYAVYAIPLDASGDITDTEKIAWHKTDTGPYVSSPVLYQGLLYVTKGKNGILSCYDAVTGEAHYHQERVPGIGTKEMYSSLVAAAGCVYMTTRDGTTVVIRHGPELEVLATNQLSEGIDASPAIVGKQIFVRGSQHLYCIEEP